jgi:hypothetical protein
MEQYPLIEEEYRAWLESLQPQEVVGTCCSYTQCAIAHYLTKIHGKRFTVVVLGDNSYFTAGKEEEHRPLPTWAIKEATWFDRIYYCRDISIVTKAQYDRAMKG